MNDERSAREWREKWARLPREEAMRLLQETTDRLERKGLIYRDGMRNGQPVFKAFGAPGGKPLPLPANTTKQ